MYDLIAMDSKVPFLVARVSLETILALRHQVLRPELPISSASFEGDESPETWHIVLTQKPDWEAICCASFMKRPVRSIEAWQLRGIATHPHYQRQGWGRILLSNAEQKITSETFLRRFWCNARCSAIPFYEGMGWKTTGPEFDIPGVGPHREMVKII